MSTYVNGKSETERLIIETKKSNRKNNISLAISIIAIIVSVIVSVYIFYAALPYQQKTLPEISLVEPNDKVELSAQKMADKDYVSAQIEAGNEEPWERVEICLKNSGRMDSGHITIEAKNEFLNRYAVNIDNVESLGEPVCGTMLLWQDGCLEPDFDRCEPEKLVNGDFKLILEIVCLNCEPQIIVKELDASIWH